MLLAPNREGVLAAGAPNTGVLLAPNAGVLDAPKGLALEAAGAPKLKPVEGAPKAEGACACTHVSSTWQHDANSQWHPLFLLQHSCCYQKVIVALSVVRNKLQEWEPGLLLLLCNCMYLPKCHCSSSGAALSGCWSRRSL